MECIDNDRIDEILERVWMRREEGKTALPDVLQPVDAQDQNIALTPEQVSQMVEYGYLAQTTEQRLTFTAQGEARASFLIRSHRLAERLFTDVLDMPMQAVESNACSFEHILSPEVQSAICSLLGHPRECPHGRLIPPGPCCAQAVREVKSIIQPLIEFKPGDKGKIVYITAKHHARLDRLSALGISPGAQITVHQTAPAYIIKSGETDVAIDEDVAQDIYIRKSL